MSTRPTIVEILTDIADAIREKMNITEGIPARELPDKLQSIVTKNIVASYADSSITNLVIPEGVTKIPDYSFNNRSSLSNITFPESLETIGAWVFNGCTSLETVTFKGTPSSLSSSIFVNCNRLNVINVPWSEGEVANAPWNANYATINYDYKG